MSSARLNRYQMRDRIATGGMGEVWHAHDTLLRRDVALKVLKGEYADDDRFRERFQTEARHAAALHHPNIATVFDFGEDDASEGTPRPYLVMELVDGRPLSQLIRPGVPMPPEQVRSLIGQSAEAIAAAHASGIVHRDVKPANLLVTPTGQVKVTDFGIARAADQVALTGTGEVIGTPHYLSPEQASGRTATPASDVYALGVVLYECLTGERPFSGDTPVTTALAHIRSPVPDLPADVPDDLAHITRRALAKDPAERYLDAAAMASALRGESAPAVPPVMEADATRLLEATAVLPGVPAAKSPGVVRPATDRRRGPRDKGVWWLLAAVVSLGTVVIVALLLNRPDSNPRASTQTFSRSPTGPATAKAATHTISAGDFVGLSATEARSRLDALGYHDVRSTTGSNPGDQTAGNVAAISPTGEVAVTTPIALTVWGQPASIAPSPPASSSPAATATAAPTGNKHGPGPKKTKKPKSPEHGEGRN